MTYIHCGSGHSCSSVGEHVEGGRKSPLSCDNHFGSNRGIVGLKDVPLGTYPTRNIEDADGTHRPRC